MAAAPAPPTSALPSPEALIAKCRAAGSAAGIEICLRNLTMRAPRVAAYRGALGAALHETKGVDPAVEAELRAAAQLAPLDAGYTAGLIEYLVRAGSVAEAGSLAKPAASKWPTSARIAAAHGSALAHAKDIDAAREEYRRAAALSKDKAGRYIREFASELEHSGQRRQAVAVLREEMRAGHAHGGDYSRIGEMLEAENLWMEAADSFMEADKESTRFLYLKTERLAARLEVKGEAKAAADVYLKLAKGNSFDARGYAEKAVAMLEKHDLRTELGRLCVDAMRDRNAFMGPSANIYTACESRLHDTSTPERTSQAAELYRVLRKAEAPFGNLPMFSPLAEHAIRLSDALAAAGKLDEAVELCGDGRMGCESLFQSRLKADDLDGAARVYRAVRGTTFGAPGLFTPAGKYRQQLIQALAEKGRGGEASALCEFSDSDCDRNIETLLQAGKQKEALEFASLRSMNGGYSLDFIASTSSSLSVEDRTALQILAARRAGNTYNLERFLAGQAYGGNVDEVGAALRKFGAGMELGKFSMHSDGDALMQMAYQGYLSARITFSTRLVDRSCLVTGPTVGYGEVLRLAFTGKAACNEGAFVEALVEHGGRVWGIDQNAVTFVVSEPDIPTRPLKQLTLAEVLPRMTANGVEADAELLDEVTLGIAAEKDILEKHKLYTDAEATAAGTAAFRKLMETSFARAGNVPSFQLLLLNEGSPNAFSTAGGRVFVNRGMLPLIQNQPGMWAAVIAHEVGHVVAHHQYKHYVRTVTLAALQRELARQAATGNKVATWGWIFSRTGGPLLNMKFGRDEELEADRLGMMMMAEAGYHPNYILALMQNLRHEVGEHGKVGTFFSSDHPRWETREKKAKQAYEEALDKFRAKWADVEKSPGGIPPQVQ